MFRIMSLTIYHRLSGLDDNGMSWSFDFRECSTDSCYSLINDGVGLNHRVDLAGGS